MTRLVLAILLAPFLAIACLDHPCKDPNPANINCWKAVNIPDSSEDSIGGDVGVVLVQPDAGCSAEADAGACATCAEAECCAEAIACPAGASCAAFDACVAQSCSTECSEVP